MRCLWGLQTDIDSVAAELRRFDGSQLDDTDQMTGRDILWGHGGLVTPHEKSLPRCLPPQRSCQPYGRQVAAQLSAELAPQRRGIGLIQDPLEFVVTPGFEQCPQGIRNGLSAALS